MRRRYGPWPWKIETSWGDGHNILTNIILCGWWEMHQSHLGYTPSWDEVVHPFDGILGQNYLENYIVWRPQHVDLWIFILSSAWVVWMHDCSFLLLQRVIVLDSTSLMQAWPLLLILQLSRLIVVHLSLVFNVTIRVAKVFIAAHFLQTIQVRNFKSWSFLAITYWERTFFSTHPWQIKNSNKY